jgi:hypothetical protein
LKCEYGFATWSTRQKLLYGWIGQSEPLVLR